MGEIDKIKRRIKKEVETSIDVDESDIPIHERFVKEEHIKQIRKKKKLI